MQTVELFYVKGAVERLLKMCRSFNYYGQAQPITAKFEADVLSHCAYMGSSGLRGLSHFILAVLVVVSKILLLIPVIVNKFFI